MTGKALDKRRLLAVMLEALVLVEILAAPVTIPYKALLLVSTVFAFGVLGIAVTHHWSEIGDRKADVMGRVQGQ